MAQFYRCFNCNKVTPIMGTITEEKFPLCESTNGQVLSRERFDEAFKEGAIFNIDPNTGKRAKKRR